MRKIFILLSSCLIWLSSAGPVHYRYGAGPESQQQGEGQEQPSETKWNPGAPQRGKFHPVESQQQQQRVGSQVPGTAVYARSSSIPGCQHQQGMYVGNVGQQQPAAYIRETPSGYQYVPSSGYPFYYYYVPVTAPVPSTSGAAPQQQAPTQQLMVQQPHSVQLQQQQHPQQQLKPLESQQQQQQQQQQHQQYQQVYSKATVPYERTVSTGTGPVPMKPTAPPPQAPISPVHPGYQSVSYPIATSTWQNYMCSVFPYLPSCQQTQQVAQPAPVVTPYQGSYQAVSGSYPGVPGSYPGYPGYQQMAQYPVYYIVQSDARPTAAPPGTVGIIKIAPPPATTAKSEVKPQSVEEDSSPAASGSTQEVKAQDSSVQESSEKPTTETKSETPRPSENKKEEKEKKNKETTVKE